MTNPPLTELHLILNEDVVSELRKQLIEIPYEIRSPKESEYRDVYEMMFKTLIKGTVGETEPSDQDYQNFLEKETRHLELGTFIWDNNKNIGQLTATLDRGEGEILELGVLPEYWRQGLATQIVLRTLIKIYEAGGKLVRLKTDSSNRYGAIFLYEKLGFTESSS